MGEDRLRVKRHRKMVKNEKRMDKSREMADIGGK